MAPGHQQSDKYAPRTVVKQKERGVMRLVWLGSAFAILFGCTWVQRQCERTCARSDGGKSGAINGAKEYIKKKNLKTRYLTMLMLARFKRRSPPLQNQWEELTVCENEISCEW